MVRTKNIRWMNTANELKTEPLTKDTVSIGEKNSHTAQGEKSDSRLTDEESMMST